MAIKYYDKYPQRWESPSNDYPQGAFKNLSAIGENDGSYLEKDWLNDQSGFFGALLRNAEMTPNGLVDTAQKSQFYDALIAVASRLIDTKISTKQDKLTFVGDGPEVMKVGAGGLLGHTTDMITILDTISKITRTRNSVLDVEIFPNNNYYNGVWAGYGTNRFSGIFIDAGQYRTFIVSQINKKAYEVYTEAITRTDKNNVLHAGTLTPIDTLNTSDLTDHVQAGLNQPVTSSGVYGALQDYQVPVEQSTGTSTTKIMSQKAVTDVVIGIGQKWVDVSEERTIGPTYINTTGKPIQLCITMSAHSSAGSIYFNIDGERLIDYRFENQQWVNSLNIIIPDGSSYSYTNGSFLGWLELR